LPGSDWLIDREGAAEDERARSAGVRVVPQVPQELAAPIGAPRLYGIVYQARRMGWVRRQPQELARRRRERDRVLALRRPKNVRHQVVVVTFHVCFCWFTLGTYRLECLLIHTKQQNRQTRPRVSSPLAQIKRQQEKKTQVLNENKSICEKIFAVQIQ